MPRGFSPHKGSGTALGDSVTACWVPGRGQQSSHPACVPCHPRRGWGLGVTQASCSCDPVQSRFPVLGA